MNNSSAILTHIAELQHQLADLQRQVSQTNHQSNHQSNHSSRPHYPVSTTVPLQRNPYQNHSQKPYEQHHSSQNGAPSYRQPRYNQSQNGASSYHQPRNVLPRDPTVVFPLSNLLRNDETVTLQVIVGKDAEENTMYGTATTVFDGTDLLVTGCELAPLFVGQKSNKPGELLYKFIDLLLEAGQLKRKFSVAPWRLCFVERDGARLSLDELRKAQ